MTKMSKHINFIKHELGEFKEVHLSIPNSDLDEAIAIAIANNLTVLTSPKTATTTTIRIAAS
jgi:hypothetical protein